MSGPNWAETAQRILGSCSCHEAYKSRGMTAPDCVWCDCSAELIEALNSAYAAGLAASGREAEIRGMERARAMLIAACPTAECGHYDACQAPCHTGAPPTKCIVATLQSEIDKARALTPTEDRRAHDAN